MQIFSLILLVISSMTLGFSIGRWFTKIECGKMLMQLMKDGLLQIPLEDIDEEDFK